MSRRECGLSIIIPTYARPRQIAGCLESLTKLVPPQSGFEVIVVDDGSRDDTPEVMQDLCAAHPALVYLRLSRNFGKEAALLAGLDHAGQGAVLFIDGDGQHPPTMAVPAEIFHRLGGFDAENFRKSAAEDRDLCFRYRELGYSLKLVPDAVIGHAHSMTLYKFCRQHFWYGQGAFHYHRKQSCVVAQSLKNDTRLHTQFYRWLPGALGTIPFRMRIPVLPMLIVWQLANAAGFVYESYHGHKLHDVR